MMKANWCFLLAALLSRGVIAADPGEAELGSTSPDEEYAVHILDKLKPVLASAGGASRFNFVGPCHSGKNPVGFPTLNLQPPSEGKTGVRAVRDMFRGNKGVAITSSASGIIRIKIGSAPFTLLQTRIPVLKLKPLEQYNPLDAIYAIQSAKEVEAARSKLGLLYPTAIVDQRQLEPAEGLPHLPSVLKDVTMDQALDAVAKAFKCVVIYGECVGGDQRYFTIGFGWVVQFY
jgi:hypothetical protein